MINALLDFLRTNWPVIEANWHILLIFGIIILGISLLLSKLFYSQQVSTLREKSSFYKEKLDALQKELDVSSPEDAEERIVELQVEITALKSKINSLMPKTVSQESLEKMTSVLRLNSGGAVEISRNMTSGNNYELYSLMVSAFKNAGWRVFTSEVLGPSDPIPSGIRVDVINQYSMTATEELVVKAISSVEAPYKIHGTGRPEHRLGERTDIALIIF